MRQMDEHPVDAYFRDQLSGARLTPPPGGWAHLQAELLQQQRSRKMLWWQAAAIGALLITAFGSGYYLSSIGEKPEDLGFAISEDRNLIEKEVSLALPTNRTESTQSGVGENAPPKLLTPFGNRINDDANHLASETPPREAFSGLLTTLASTETDGSHNSVSNSDKPFAYARMQPLAATHILNPALQSKVAVIIRRAEFTSNLFADNSVSDDDKSNHWQFGGQIAPLYAFHQPTPNKEQSYFVTTSQSSQSGQEKPILSFSASMRASVPLNKSISLNSGIGFTRLGQETQNTSLLKDIDQVYGVTTFSAVTSAGEIQLQSETIQTLGQIISTYNTTSISPTGSITQHFDYLEIPLTLSIDLINKNPNIQVEAGVSSGFLVNNTAFFTNNGERFDLGTTESIKKVLWNGIAGLSLRLPLGNKFTIGCYPNIRYALAPINALSNYRPWAFGIGTGIVYELK